MNKLFLFLFMFFFTGLGVQAVPLWQGEREKTIEIREKIGLDYTVPDFQVTKIIPETIGARLAKLLRLLEANYKQGVYNHYLSRMMDRQLDDEKQHFLTIEKLKIRSIRKQDSVISVRVQLQSSETRQMGKLKRNVDFVFVNGVSSDIFVNDLFCDLAHYLKDDE